MAPVTARKPQFNDFQNQHNYSSAYYQNLEQQLESGIPFQYENSHVTIPETAERATADNETAENKADAPKDRLAELKQTLNEGVRNLMQTDRFKNYLNTCARSAFGGGYSFRNALLMAIQKEDVSFVAGYQEWKKYGRQVSPGAKGITILSPSFAYEKVKGGLASAIKRSLDLRINDHNYAEWRLGESSLSFTMDKAGNIGYKKDGKEGGIFKNYQHFSNFLDKYVIGKIPVGYRTATVFDVADTYEPEFLYLRSGFTKNEVALDQNGQPVKNSKGEYKIINGPERKLAFQAHFVDFAVPENDPAQMQQLLEVMKQTAAAKGITVIERSKQDDELLSEGALGYYSQALPPKAPQEKIVIDQDLTPTQKATTMLHELAHADLHNHGNLKQLENAVGDEITRQMKEIQAEAVAYAVGKSIGLNTDTKSFQYLAVYSNGTELQDLNKSMEVIYKATKSLANDIAAANQALELAKEKAENAAGIENVEPDNDISNETYLTERKNPDSKLFSEFSVEKVPPTSEIWKEINNPNSFSLWNPGTANVMKMDSDGTFYLMTDNGGKKVEENQAYKINGYTGKTIYPGNRYVGMPRPVDFLELLRERPEVKAIWEAKPEREAKPENAKMSMKNWQNDIESRKNDRDKPAATPAPENDQHHDKDNKVKSRQNKENEERE